MNSAEITLNATALIIEASMKGIGLTELPSVFGEAASLTICTLCRNMKDKEFHELVQLFEEHFEKSLSYNRKLFKEATNVPG